MRSVNPLIAKDFFSVNLDEIGLVRVGLKENFSYLLLQTVLKSEGVVTVSSMSGDEEEAGPAGRGREG